MAKKKKNIEITEPLICASVVPVDYMKLNGSIAKAIPGQVIDTPTGFVKQRLAEGIWKHYKDSGDSVPPVKEKKEVSE